VILICNVIPGLTRNLRLILLKIIVEYFWNNYEVWQEKLRALKVEKINGI
jgi:hypothetical protein